MDFRTELVEHEHELGLKWHIQDAGLLDHGLDERGWVLSTSEVVQCDGVDSKAFRADECETWNLSMSFLQIRSTEVNSLGYLIASFEGELLLKGPN